VARIVWVGIGLALALFAGLCGGISSILADADHLVEPIVVCGIPPSLPCYLANSGGRVFHSYYVIGSGIVLCIFVALFAGLLVRTTLSRGAGVEDILDGDANEEGERHEGSS